jgi:hypothetical protein
MNLPVESILSSDDNMVSKNELPFKQSSHQLALISPNSSECRQWATLFTKLPQRIKTRKS